MNFTDFFTNLSSRKLLISTALLTISTVCLFTKLASFDQWTAFSIWVLGIYSAANVGEHAATTLKKPVA